MSTLFPGVTTDEWRGIVIGIGIWWALCIAAACVVLWTGRRP